MNRLDTVLVALCILGAIAYLCRVFKPNHKTGKNCACPRANCPANKPFGKS